MSSEKPISFKMEIILYKDGQLVMNGPLQDKTLCYGLLMQAVNMVNNYQASPIVPFRTYPPDGENKLSN